jgi:hypothetical protein
MDLLDEIAKFTDISSYKYENGTLSVPISLYKGRVTFGASFNNGIRREQYNPMSDSAFLEICTSYPMKVDIVIDGKINIKNNQLWITGGGSVAITRITNINICSQYVFRLNYVTKKFTIGDLECVMQHFTGIFNKIKSFITVDSKIELLIIVNNIVANSERIDTYEIYSSN